MIKATFLLNEDFKVKGFELKGHAYYDEFGYDIVCSAVTSNVIAVVNSLETLQKVGFESCIAEDGRILCIIKDEYIEKSQLLFNHLELALEQISKEYPKNIKIFKSRG